MTCACLRSIAKILTLPAVLAASTFALAQSELQTRTLVINGQSGKATIYRINDHSFIDLESLVRVANGSISFQGDQIILSLPSNSVSQVASNTAPPSQGMTKNFMTAALQDVSVIRDWYSTMASAIQRGVPGDGSHLAVYHDRAAEGLHLATAQASSQSDHASLQLLNNLFHQVDRWKTHLVDSRKSMSSANYSLTPNSLDTDPAYQGILSCSQFLSSMLASGQYQDTGPCH